MLIKILLGALLLFMLFNLFTAMLIMLKGDSSKGPMSKYIGRVMTSVIIILLIVVAVASGLITPNPRPY